MRPNSLGHGLIVLVGDAEEIVVRIGLEEVLARADRQDEPVVLDLVLNVDAGLIDGLPGDLGSGPVRDISVDGMEDIDGRGFGEIDVAALVDVQVVDAEQKLVREGAVQKLASALLSTENVSRFSDWSTE